MALLTTRLLAGASIATCALAQFGNHGSPFPNITYQDAVSQNPLVQQGARTNQTSPPKYPSPWGRGSGDWAAAYEKAAQLVSQMTLEEKVNLTTGTGWSMDQCVGNTGSVPRLGIRALCFQDSPTGLRFTDFNSVFSAGVNIAASWDKTLAYLRGEAMGEEYRDKGVDGPLGPVAGPLGREAEGGRNWEGFSPDPYLTGVMFAESIQGIQSTGMMAVAKHFILNEQEHFRQVGESINYGFEPSITYPGSSNTDDTTLHELYLWPFADAVRAGVVSIMCSYNRINNSDGCQNSYTLNYLLKGELDFQGYILSDWQATHSGVSSVLAGLDLTMPGDTEFDTGKSYLGPNLTIAVLNGTVPQWRLDDMVVRIVAGWYYVDGPAAQKPINFNSWTLDTYGPEHWYVGPEWGHGLINQHVDVRQEHGRLIRRIGADSTVLLKNNGSLPLTGREKLTAVFGEDSVGNPAGPNGCPDRGCDQGTLGMAWGSGSSNFPYLVTPEAALQREITDHFGAFESVTNNSASPQIAGLAKRVGEVGGVCIAFANADAGEGFINVDGNYGDRKNLTLWQNAENMLANVTSNCNNTVIVIHSVGAVFLEQYKNHPNVTAILWAGIPGEQSGNSIADILYGRVNPSAKLPFTIGKTREDYGTDVLYTPNGVIPQFNFEEGVMIDYRGFDARNITPTYEFGYGLSYTSFEYANLSVVAYEGVGNYTPNTVPAKAAPTYGTIDNNTKTHAFPTNFTRVPLYIYPWLNSTNLTEAYGHTDYGDWSFIPENALNGSAQPAHPAGGAPGGNPQLWDALYCVTVKVTNTGKVGGQEVVQLYVSLGGQYDPKLQLRGFAKVSIDPGETVEVKFDLLRRDISNWDTVSQNWVITGAPKTAYVGPSSRQLPLSAALS